MVDHSLISFFDLFDELDDDDDDGNDAATDDGGMIVNVVANWNFSSVSPPVI
jgi:hypothetical protein